MIEQRAKLAEWAQGVIGAHVDAASEAIAEFCAKPASAKRLHRTRKRLARLRAVLDDLAVLAGVTGTFSERIRRVHRRAGKVRDADVLPARVEAYREDAFGEERDELDRLRKALQKRAKRMRRKLTQELQR
ncbi:MAG TPA: CHAD domain-containing protein [Candidatus Baltobacteraceae bacterium]|nr:CHAD domain-containing protein [Candidatus Baltobacteraceae bacterium]